MDGRGIELLKQLKEFSEKIDLDNYLPDGIVKSVGTLAEESKNEEGGTFSEFLPCLKLLNQLEGVAKSSKLIRELIQHKNVHPSEQTKIDDEETAESFQGTSELNESTDINVPAESLESTPSKHSKEVDESIDEDKNAESLQKDQCSEIKPPEERKTFHVLMDVSRFLRKQLSIKVIGKYLVVSGEHEMLLDEHGKVSRKFTRKFEIPEDVDRETFRAFVDCYRVLTIEASFKPVIEKDGVFEVPIYAETGSKPISSAIQSLEEDFDTILERHLRDARFMRDFARNLAKYSPSDYIPMEEVLKLLV